MSAPPNVSLLRRLTKFKTVITNKLFNRKLIFIDRNTSHRFIHQNMNKNLNLNFFIQKIKNLKNYNDKKKLCFIFFK